MGLNVSKSQISKELDLSLSDVHEMTTLLRTTVVERKPEVTFAGEVEFEKVYIVAGHKGHPEALTKSAEFSIHSAKRLDGDGSRRAGSRQTVEVCYFSGLSCFWIYALSTSNGAPPAVIKQYALVHSTGFQ